MLESSSALLAESLSLENVRTQPTVLMVRHKKNGGVGYKVIWP